MTTQNDITLLEKADALLLGDRSHETRTSASEGHSCSECGRPIRGRRRNGYCSDRCRMRVSRRANRTRILALLTTLSETVASLEQEMEATR
jgi:predicted nucleic acid-binding Zn ribbon protein